MMELVAVTAFSDDNGDVFRRVRRTLPLVSLALSSSSFSPLLSFSGELTPFFSFPSLLRASPSHTSSVLAGGSTTAVFFLASSATSFLLTNDNFTVEL
ncbi:hypothetical protein HN51_016823 [Arachis hypogaea]